MNFAVRLLYRTLLWIAAIVLGVALGKWMQYGAVELLGDRLGFNGASMIGIGVFATLALWLAHKLPAFPKIKPKK